MLHLSAAYNASLPFFSLHVLLPLITFLIFSVLFVYVELKLALEPVLAPSLLRMKIPVLVGCSNFLVAMCNFSIMYFLPMWFVTVAGTSASIAGACWMLLVSLDVS